MLKIMAIVTATNLTNSPFDFLDADNATVRFPAYGSATGDFTGSQLDLLNFWIAAGGFTDKVAPTNTEAPELSGTSSVGSVLTTTDGQWIGNPVITVRWQRSANGTSGWADIAGQTGNTYTLVPADEGAYVRSVITGENDYGATEAPSDIVAGPIEAA